jgi:THO complex subunit 1
LIILRSCNELLRRLSRAEDTVFCGRVFIFLFQSFPLGDKSSVNLRGEYHTENVTGFDDIRKPPSSSENEMEIDASGGGKSGSATQPTAHDGGVVPPPTEAEGTKQEEPLNMDSLYPLFWGLQAYFSAPTRLFDAEFFASFKRGIEATLANFRQVSTHLDLRGGLKGAEDSRRGVKRKRNGDTAEVTNSFNPKYLTSRDLFELEVGPISILQQSYSAEKSNCWVLDVMCCADLKSR